MEYKCPLLEPPPPPNTHVVVHVELHDKNYDDEKDHAVKRKTRLVVDIICRLIFNLSLKGPPFGEGAHHPRLVVQLTDLAHSPHNFVMVPVFERGESYVGCCRKTGSDSRTLCLGLRTVGLTVGNSATNVARPEEERVVRGWAYSGRIARGWNSYDAADDPKRTRLRTSQRSCCNLRA